jgi:hypothetical protein
MKIMRLLEDIFQRTLDKLSTQFMTFAPPLLVAIAILAFTWVIALLVRWALTKLVKGTGLDRWLVELGVTSLVGRSGGLHTAPLIASTAYWLILGAGLLAAVDAFNTSLSNRFIEATVLLFPKLVTAGLILLAGGWLAQFLARSTLVWAVNESLPAPRRWAAFVRVAVLLLTAVVAADTLDFARIVFLTAFLIFAGGAMLTASIAVGVAGADILRRYAGQPSERSSRAEEDSLWKHI